MHETYALVSLPTAHGAFQAVLSADGVCSLSFPNEPGGAGSWLARRAPGAGPRAGDPRAGALAEELDAYLRGDLRTFSLTPDLRGTEFQRRVWERLLAIPYGEVRSYGEVAAAIGRPSAVRAVGAANGANPVPIVVPCHRVIGSDGRLVGFGAGLDWKRRLLALEECCRRAQPRPADQASTRGSSSERREMVASGATGPAGT